MRDFIDKTSEQNGTPINRDYLMAIQGFDAKITVFNDDSITETYKNGHTLSTTFNSDGSVTETFIGDKIITKKIIFKQNEIEEVLL